MFNISNQSEKKKITSKYIFFIFQKKNYTPNVNILVKFHHQPKNQIKPLLEPKPSSS